MATPRKDPKDKLKVGRHTDYRVEHCEALIESAKQGESLIEFAASIPCAMATVYLWLEKHPEFMEAKKIAEPLRERWWVNAGKAMMTGQVEKANATIFVWMTKNMLKWRDRHDVEVSGPQGGPMRLELLTDEELKEKAAKLIEKAKALGKV